MNQIIHPATLFKGSIEVPSDKSLTHRALLLSALSNGVSTIKNPLSAEDCLSTARCLEDLGVKIERGPKKWKVFGKGLWGFKKPQRILDCGNSGTTMRLISGLLAAQNFSVVLEGDSSLSARPMKRMAEPLRAMGARISLRDETFAPVKIQGVNPLKSIDWKSEVASAQIKSCVLLAGLHAKGVTTFSEPTISRDHTERMLESSGVAIKKKGTSVSVRGPSEPQPQNWIIPGDISSAAFFIVAGALVKNSSVKIKNVILNPTRTGIMDVLKKAGVSMKIENLKKVSGEPVGDIHVTNKESLQAFGIAKEIVPRLIDEIPILAVLATQARGVSRWSGLEELRIKETDRLKALAENLNRMGAKIKEEKDGLVITGPTPLLGTKVDSFGDHRIAMAMAVAGLISRGETTIVNSEVVSISFPDFWEKLHHLQIK